MKNTTTKCFTLGRQQHVKYLNAKFQNCLEEYKGLDEIVKQQNNLYYFYLTWFNCFRKCNWCTKLFTGIKQHCFRLYVQYRCGHIFVGKIQSIGIYAEMILQIS